MRQLVIVVPLILLLTVENAGASPAPDALDAQQAAARLLGGALAGGEAATIARSLADEVGARFAGTPGAERAVAWALARMKSLGLVNVHAEKVMVPRWIRGAATGEVVAPHAQPLALVALGGSAGTPDGGVTGEVLEVASLDELKAAGERVRGKIVFFDKVMERTHDFHGYGAAAPVRSVGPQAAAELGALAAMVRSAGTGHHRLPHTGATRFEDRARAIPSVALASEDAELLHRLLASGASVRVRLALGCRYEADVESANVVGDVPARGGGKAGAGGASELVILGAHLDSWDLATGALDDAAGVGIVLSTAHALLARDLAPRRTVRVVLFMNEEMGLQGARAYAAAHASEAARTVAALEADAGAGAPTGVAVTGNAAAAESLRALLAPLAALGLTSVRSTEDLGADVSTLQAQGVPVVAVEQDAWDYFEWHHSAGDTADKIDARDLALTAGAFAVVVRQLAEWSGRLPPPPAPTRLRPASQSSSSPSSTSPSSTPPSSTSPSSTSPSSTSQSPSSKAPSLTPSPRR